MRSHATPANICKLVLLMVQNSSEEIKSQRILKPEHNARMLWEIDSQYQAKREFLLTLGSTEIHQGKY